MSGVRSRDGRDDDDGASPQGIRESMRVLFGFLVLLIVASLLATTFYLPAE
ncbi:MAG: hypothetical protein ACRDF0_05835 [Candidatus Limnocylindria bacterium]